MKKQRNKIKQQQQQLNVEPVKVYCRLSPLLDYKEKERGDPNLDILKDEHNLIIQVPEYSSASFKLASYSFQKIFSDKSTSKELFEETGLPLVRDLVCGKNGLLFTYGKQQTLSDMLQPYMQTLFNSISCQQAKKDVILHLRLVFYFWPILNAETKKKQKNMRKS